MVGKDGGYKGDDWLRSKYRQSHHGQAPDMKVKYSRDVDILLVRLFDDAFDSAEENGGVITHFSKQGKPVLLEIQGGRDFLLSSLTSVMEESEVTFP